MLELWRVRRRMEVLGLSQSCFQMRTFEDCFVKKASYEHNEWHLDCQSAPLFRYVILIYIVLVYWTHPHYIYIYYTCSSYCHALLDLLVQKVHHLKPSGTLRDGRVGRGLGERCSSPVVLVLPHWNIFVGLSWGTHAGAKTTPSTPGTEFAASLCSTVALSSWHFCQTSEFRTDQRTIPNSTIFIGGIETINFYGRFVTLFFFALKWRRSKSFKVSLWPLLLS